MYTVVKKDDGTIELEYEGKAGKLLPKIKSVNTKATTSSITVKVDATRVDKGEYRFYIKDKHNKDSDSSRPNTSRLRIHI